MEVRYLNKNHYIYTLEFDENQFAKGKIKCNITIACILYTLLDLIICIARLIDTT